VPGSSLPIQTGQLSAAKSLTAATMAGAGEGRADWHPQTHRHWPTRRAAIPRSNLQRRLQEAA
jgi:hypothetical protein